MKRSQDPRFDAYLAKMKSLLKEEGMGDLLNSFKTGRNHFLRMSHLESSGFDMSWIEEIEGVIFDLGDIIGHPKETTKVVESIVPVELAKKTGAESVRHLASHTQFIKEVDEHGNVTPNKILTLGNEENIITYENRFIATFVRRLLLFVQKRYEFALHFVPLHEENILMFKTKAIVDGAEVELETRLKVRTESDDPGATASASALERIAKIREYVLYFYSTPFMRKFRTERDVRNPILMTNILRKNPKYHHCYEVYKFIERYNRLGVAHKVKEEYRDFNEEDVEEVALAMMSSYLTIHAPISMIKKTEEKEYKPKILTSIDDEQFYYGPIVKGPVETVRMDEEYMAYLASKGRRELPLHPTKREREYYEDEYAERQEARDDIRAIQLLMKRKKKEQQKWESDVERIIAERTAAEEQIAKAIVEIERQENELYLDSIREGLVTSAIADRDKAEDMISRASKGKKKAAPAEPPVSGAPVTSDSKPSDVPADASSVEAKPSEVKPAEAAPVSGGEGVSSESKPEPRPESKVGEDSAILLGEEVPAEGAEESSAKPKGKKGKGASKSKASSKEKPSSEPTEEPKPEEAEPVAPMEEAKPEPKPVAAKEEPKPKAKKEDKPAASEENEEAGEYTDGFTLNAPALRGKSLKDPSETEEYQSAVSSIKATGIVFEPVKPDEAKRRNLLSQEFSVDLTDPNWTNCIKPNKQAAKKPVPEKKEEVPLEEHEEEASGQVIEGRFVVKTPGGYFVSKSNFTVYKEQARVFLDYNEALEIKRRYGGKVVKL